MQGPGDKMSHCAEASPCGWVLLNSEWEDGLEKSTDRAGGDSAPQAASRGIRNGLEGREPGERQADSPAGP